ncbi:MAG: hypothetical protein IPK75_20080 [Acidobacteria bacterium]|nr:hypothetical protein [Acidobacteriota bacterium]
MTKISDARLRELREYFGAAGDWVATDTLPTTHEVRQMLNELLAIRAARAQLPSDDIDPEKVSVWSHAYWRERALIAESIRAPEGLRERIADGIADDRYDESVSAGAVADRILALLPGHQGFLDYCRSRDAGDAERAGIRCNLRSR